MVRSYTSAPCPNQGVLVKTGHWSEMDPVAAVSILRDVTGTPQGCVLSPLLYSPYTYDCTATSSSTIIVKFADDTVVMGLISDNDKRAYLEEIKHLENWCQANKNNLLLNVSKTKELIVDCSKKQEQHYQPVRISGTTVERVDSFRHLRDFRLPSKVLQNFHTCTIESILTGNITVWFRNSTKQDRQALQRVVRSAERITHTELSDLQTIYYKRCQTKARRIVKDPTHPNNRLFSLLRQTNREADRQLVSWERSVLGVDRRLFWARAFGLAPENSRGQGLPTELATGRKKERTQADPLSSPYSVLLLHRPETCLPAGLESGSLPRTLGDELEKAGLRSVWKRELSAYTSQAEGRGRETSTPCRLQTLSASLQKVSPPPHCQGLSEEEEKSVAERFCDAMQGKS
ncbi:hypothetical protein P4O66_000174 [Electrophorus voltai]|uniref:Reverse transcriptase domain-containing protein n=1 Tax=Electrophorus voltai TaxID=2609070 RepID=A0AAD9E6K8_9TELE|nr:hypothetical protein P4O66_000174 [Electrophorus voltai]